MSNVIFTKTVTKLLTTLKKNSISEPYKALLTNDF